jgi:hypothetical protein
MLPGRVSNFYGTSGHLVAGKKRHIWSKFCMRYDHRDIVPFFHYITETLVSENIFRNLLTLIVGQDSIVSIVTCYGLDIPGIKSRGEFSAPVQTGLGAHPPCTWWVTGHSQGWRSQSVALTTHQHIAPGLQKELSYASTSHLSLHGRL